MVSVATTPLRALVEARRDDIKATAARHKGRAVAVFGSVARGEERADSDIDMLIDFEDGSSLFDLMHVEDDLFALLGRPVDAVALAGLKARDDDIRQEAIWL